MMEFDWQIALGEGLGCSVEEFRQLTEANQRLVRYKGRYVEVSAQQVASMMQQVSKPPVPLTPYELLRASLDPESSPVWLDGQVLQVLGNMTRVTGHAVPSALKADLREYQARGFQWVVSTLSNGFGAILADDMGLGKTVQAITAILWLRQEVLLTRPALVVAPTSLITNWQSELAKFAPGLRVVQYYGSQRSVDHNTQGAQKRARVHLDTDAAHVIITSYGTLRMDVGKLKGMSLGMILIDEAQAIQNSSSQVSKAVKSVAAPLRLALSGTPVENKLAELHSIFDFVMPGYLGTGKEFAKEYAKPIEGSQDMAQLERLKKVTAPFMLRRLKTDKNIIKDLPDNVVADTWSCLTASQASLYQAVVDDNLKKLADAQAKKEAGINTGNIRGGVVLSMLATLKQICNHPANYDTSADATAESSGKTMLLLDILEPILAKGEKVIIFTQYVRMLSLLSTLVRHHCLAHPVVLQGSMTRKMRDQAVQRFQSDPSAQVFIVSTKAGGVGLNLTAANHVVHYDLWWNPAVEQQATDRAFRIGQTRTVFVHRIITKGTFEERINDMIQRKRELSVSSGESWITQLSNEELQEMFAMASGA